MYNYYYLIKENVDVFIQFSELITSIESVVTIIASIIAIVGGFCWYNRHIKEKESEAIINQKSEILKNRQTAYIEINQVLLFLQDKTIFNDCGSEYRNFFLKNWNINNKNDVYLGVDKTLLIPIRFSNQKESNKTILELYNFYRKNCLYFSEDVNCMFVEIIQILLSYYDAHAILVRKMCEQLSNRAYNNKKFAITKIGERLEKESYHLLYFSIEQILDEK